MLVTKVDLDVIPSKGDSDHLEDWVLSFNALKAKVKSDNLADEIHNLGYLALPHI